MQFNVVLLGAEPMEADAHALSCALAPNGKLISILPLPGKALLEAAGECLVKIDINLTYSGIVARYLEAERAFGTLG